MMGKAVAAFKGWSEDHIKRKDNHIVARSEVADALWGWAGEQSELEDVVKYHREMSLAYCVGRGLAAAGFDTRSKHHDYVHIRLE